MGAYGAPDVAIAGLLDSFPNVVESAIAQEDIAFGAPVFGMVGVENKAYNYHKEIATATLDADLVTSNVYTLVINGVTVDETFATDHATTMTAFIATINADASIAALGITAAAGTTNRIIVLTAPADLDLTVTGAVTLGATQAAVAIVYSSGRKFLGVAVFVQNGGVDFGAGTSLWEETSSVNILKTGRIWVLAEATVADKDPAYAVSLGAGTAGKFTDVSTSNYDIGSYFRGNVTGGLALLEVRGMK